MKEFAITDKVNQHSLIGVTMDTPIEVEIVTTVNTKTGTIRCIAYQIKDGLIVAEGPELEKYIPQISNYPVMLFAKKSCGEIVKMAIKQGLFTQQDADYMVEKINKELEKLS